MLRDDLNFVPYKVTNPARICAVAGGGGGRGGVFFCGESLTAAIDSAMECWSVEDRTFLVGSGSDL